MNLKSQRVVVIGGSSGIGFATAAAAAAEGASVTVAASDESRLEAAVEALPDNCDSVVVDVRSEASVQALFSRVDEFDHLVFTAGDTLAFKPLSELTIDEARQQFEVRFWGAVTAAKYAAPLIRPGGSITLTSGTVAARPRPGTTFAASGAGAIEALTRGLAVELAPIRVNAVAPGVIRTPVWDSVPESERTGMFAMLADQTLTNSTGDPDEIAATHLYLMKNRYVTGTVMTVDGGGVLK